MRSFSMRTGGMLRRYGGFRRELGSFGQEGGGFSSQGSAPVASWTPASLSLLAWYRSDDVTVTGANVDSWNDKSGNGRHGVGTTTRRPVYASNQINGNGALAWDEANNTRLVVTGLTVPTNGTVITVGKLTSGKTGWRCILGGGSTPAQFFQDDTSTGAATYWLATGKINVGATATNDGAWRVIRQMWGASNLSLAYNNGAAQTASRAGLNSVANTFATIGEFSDGSLKFDGQFAEIIVCNTELTAGEITSLNEYLSARYALW